ncbi:hypothetical protein L596_003509 [Steinernema carpocapsae]|uniref:Uncharacterized protein n=1 Tax=Steinernema carpocapsae TaxID=34508 RepID=A0A4U8UUE5_STECR|nr:hypothetical protein L596_003509 [Steinernema carpocapsae]
MLPKNLDHQLMIRVLFGLHFTLTAVTLLASWPPTAFLFYNVLLGGYLWLAITSTSFDLALQKCGFVEVLSIPLDVLCIALFYNSSTKEGIDKVAFIACTIQVIVRFGGLIVLRRIKKERPTPVAPSYEIVGEGQVSQHPQQNVPAYQGASYEDTAPKNLGGGFNEINRFAQQQQQHQYNPQFR